MPPVRAPKPGPYFKIQGAQKNEAFLTKNRPSITPLFLQLGSLNFAVLISRPIANQYQNLVKIALKMASVDASKPGPYFKIRGAR